MSEITVEGKKVRFIEAGRGLPLVLLHGWSFNSDTWAESGILQELATRYKIYAIDMPYGVKTKSERFKASRREYAAFLRRILDALNLADPPIVGPSASGEVALWYVAQGFPTRGAVVVGPVGLTEELISAVAKSGVPILAIWGERDEISPPSNAALLRGNVKTAFIQGAGHAAYLDKPAEFISLLLTFLRDIRYL